jgi:hypothetical protein
MAFENTFYNFSRKDLEAQRQRFFTTKETKENV